MKSARGHLVVTAAGGEQGRLVDEVGQVGAHHPRRGRGELGEVDVVGQRHRARVHLQDQLAAHAVGRLHGHSAVEAARSQQGGVEHLWPVGRAEHDHAGGGVEAVHLGEDLVERLLALVVATQRARAAAPRAADRVELVDEDDRGRRLLGLHEQVAHARGADAHDRLDELRRAGGEEWDAGLAGHGTGQQRLARAGEPGQQHAARDAGPELGVLLSGCAGSRPPPPARSRPRRCRPRPRR